MNAPFSMKEGFSDLQGSPGRTIVGESVSIRNLKKSFGKRQVFADLDLQIASGEFLAIVGRSGCGKTTLLRLLSGLEQPDGGELLLSGKSVSGFNARTRLLFQDARLLPWQTVLENVGIARAPDWHSTALKALKDVGLADRAGDWPSILSGGQKQRVALARALVSKPHVLLLDEPFGALDALTRTEMHDLLLNLWSERGFTAILITHDVGEALALADRVVVLRDGQAVFDEKIPVHRAERDKGNSVLARLYKEIISHV